MSTLQIDKFMELAETSWETSGALEQPLSSKRVLNLLLLTDLIYHSSKSVLSNYLFP